LNVNDEQKGLWQKLVLKPFNVNFSGRIEWNYEDTLLRRNILARIGDTEVYVLNKYWSFTALPLAG